MIKEIKDSEIRSYIKRLVDGKVFKKDSIEMQTIGLFIIDDPNQSVNEVAFRIAQLTMNDFQNILDLIHEYQAKGPIIYITHDRLESYNPHVWTPGTLQDNYDRFVKIYTEYIKNSISKSEDLSKFKPDNKEVKKSTKKKTTKNTDVGDDDAWQKEPVESIEIPSHTTLEKYLELSKKAALMIGSQQS